MSGFTFGTSSQPATGTNLFGTSSKPLFGAATTGQTGLFGTPTTTTAASTGLFGSIPKTTAATGGLFGAAPLTTTTASSLFGSSTTTTQSLFGTSMSTSSTGLFAKPTTGLFGAPAAASGSLFGSTPGATTSATTTAPVGLGGGGTLSGSEAGSSAAGGSFISAGASAAGNPLEAELPQALVDMVNQLKAHSKRNQEISEEIAMNSSGSYLKLEEALDEVRKMRVHTSNDVRNVKFKAQALLDTVQRDLRAAEQMQKRQQEMSKDPQLGRKQVFDYLMKLCAEYESSAAQLITTVQSLEEQVSAMSKQSDEALQIKAEDLKPYLETHDKLLKAVCADVYQCDNAVQDLRDRFLERRKHLMPYAPNPFNAEDDTVEPSDSQSRFVGQDAFPSLVTMMKIGEMARASAPSQPASTSLFGSKPFGSTSFPFGSTGTSTSAPLFKPFTTATSSSLFGSAATSTAGAAASAPTSSFTFGNTLNSSVSGTLFGGSASKPFGR